MADVNTFIQNNADKNSRVVESYTLIGNQEYLDEDKKPRVKDEDNALAKSVSINNKYPKFYVKVGTYGKIYNPIGLYSEGREQKFLSKIGRKEFEFKEVNRKIFDLYVNFLATKNLAWLNNAERELS
jgi:hypothetical protein